MQFIYEAKVGDKFQVVFRNSEQDPLILEKIPDNKWS